MSKFGTYRQNQYKLETIIKTVIQITLNWCDKNQQCKLNAFSDIWQLYIQWKLMTSGTFITVCLAWCNSPMQNKHHLGKQVFYLYSPDVTATVVFDVILSQDPDQPRSLIYCLLSQALQEFNKISVIMLTQNNQPTNKHNCLGRHNKLSETLVNITECPTTTSKLLVDEVVTYTGQNW